MGFEGKSFCLKLCVLCFTFLFWVLGAAIFGFCLWLRLDFWYDHNIGVNSVLKIYHIAIYIAIAVGGLIIIFGIIGCVGAIASRLVLLVLFLVFLVLIFLLEVAGVAYCCVKREEFQNTISEGNLFRGFIQTDYGSDQGKTRIIDFVQWKLKCCGGQRYTDYLSSSWAHQNQNNIGQVPLSCCADYKSNEASNINNYGCKAEGNLSYKKGCGRAIVNLVEERLLLITGIVVAILGLQLFGFLFIVLLICYLRKPPPQQPDDVVYEMARTQEKAPYPTRGNTYSNL
ncbi:tetraspanin-8-like [Octopus vulgaris]|uniref:Tetraspanin-8-like n=2 Tax=Octopus TaxID=6643 RepID=A0AA36AXS5_OCTVU|nr:tetraspanin-8 [Octopus sinensis]CAI9722837.1 tetraspanin-8-like [Octopus vulgaris]